MWFRIKQWISFICFYTIWIAPRPQLSCGELLRERSPCTRVMLVEVCNIFCVWKQDWITSWAIKLDKWCGYDACIMWTPAEKIINYPSFVKCIVHYYRSRHFWKRYILPRVCIKKITHLKYQRPKFGTVGDSKRTYTSIK